jgi:hypothetical protein
VYTLVKAFSPKKKTPLSLATIEQVTKEFHEIMHEASLEIYRFSPHIIVIEFPDRTQHFLDAISLGVCRGIAQCLFNFHSVQPSLLKDWSGSKRGDKKLIVKDRVVERVPLSQEQAKDNNIVDAVGLCLIILDLVTYYESKR